MHILCRQASEVSGRNYASLCVKSGKESNPCRIFKHAHVRCLTLCLKYEKDNKYKNNKFFLLFCYIICTPTKRQSKILF